jgi:regulator of protease activity HflC (stomatin/prohibitin superfamily)
VLGAGGVLVAHYRRIVAAREREVFERAREAEAEREEKIRQWRASMNLPDETVVFVDPPVYY